MASPLSVSLTQWCLDPYKSKKEALQNINPCQNVNSFLTICPVDSFKFPSKNNVVLAAKAVYGNCDFDEGVTVTVM